MNNDTDTITLSRERFRAMLAVNLYADSLIRAVNNGTALIPFYTERLAEKVAHAESLREAEWTAAKERSARTREMVARLRAERDLGVD